ncbi:hypothetical protein [Bradyrhizobium sp. SZCCHNS3053]|uniref:hypothetical protein n=1 Tax=Bradyrhizobium sp. SZCCHNS3053 TaxID=3057322 RepID=UPI00291652BE|nr:hypothetical protein [Bradyrhizobium sp. SZCCHNS3053]
MELQLAEKLADDLIAAEIAKQDAMWGRLNERADTSRGQLFDAAHAQIWLTMAKIEGSSAEDALESAKHLYPGDWSGFRDYGSHIANIVVAIAFLRQEIKRKLMNGEDFTRAARQPDQPYNPETGLPKV